LKREKPSQHFGAAQCRSEGDVFYRHSRESGNLIVSIKSLLSFRTIERNPIYFGRVMRFLLCRNDKRKVLNSYITIAYSHSLAKGNLFIGKGTDYKSATTGV
jgi:hypothetical protein